MTDEEWKKGIRACVALALMPAGIFFSGYVVARLWSWHVSPMFHLPLMSTRTGIGLDTLYTLVTMRVAAARNEKLDPLDIAFVSIYATAMALLVGWWASC